MVEAGLKIGPDAEQGFEVMLVQGFPSRQVEGDDVAAGAPILRGIFVAKSSAPATRALARLGLVCSSGLDTCASTMVEVEDVWMRRADELIAASVSSKCIVDACFAQAHRSASTRCS